MFAGNIQTDELYRLKIIECFGLDERWEEAIRLGARPAFIFILKCLSGEKLNPMNHM
jgi:hypothetical protein